ncbi:arsenite efflux transporter metallochaperone ArsD [Pseudorhodoferax sp.]|uniref:arsenite efflux transporter metallochaperone ArsD n=1 Tax=Pseudorhodoferax sp. TaxID=1993553 RepID=UPI002DD62E16|nr:arsenite efflux transporter metallochaperone ArsD [Pseudorhodoferax sp.]
MPSLQIYDPAMCCSSGVCGPDIDPLVLRIAADLDWARAQGAPVQRFNLAQQPGAFAEQATVRRLLEQSGAEVLPVTLLDGELVLAGRYPSREQLARWLGLAAPAAASTGGCGCGAGRCA